MNAKERIIVFTILLIALLFLPLTLKAITEDEMVAEQMERLEKKRAHRMVVPFFSFSYGNVNPTSYHKFVNTMNTNIVPEAGSIGPLSNIDGVTSFEFGCGVGVDKGLLSLGFSRWLTSGSANSGDYRVYFDLQAGLYEEVEDFTFTSEFKVWGIFLDYQYFVLNAPQPLVKTHGLSLRIGGGLGFYAGQWHLWDGFGGYREDTGEWYELKDPLTGSGFGYHLAAGVEYPFWKGFNIALDTKYLWLEFERMKKMLSANYELYLLEEYQGDPVRLDFTGPRVNLTLKRYFTL